MNLSGILGLVVTVATIAGAILLGPTGVCGVAFFVNIPSIIFVLGVGCGSALMASSARDLGRALWGIRVLTTVPSPDDVSPQDASILRALALRLYIAGAGGTLIGLVQMLASLDDPAQISSGLSVALLTVFTAFVLSEVLLRPAAQRIDSLAAQQAPCSEL